MSDCDLLARDTMQSHKYNVCSVCKVPLPITIKLEVITMLNAAHFILLQYHYVST